MGGHHVADLVMAPASPLCHATVSVFASELTEGKGM